ncbi:MAG: recombinase family protein [Rhodobacteraceae bacterium]|nr:recombinase family protein [Paracoccaceae bacterium]
MPFCQHGLDAQTRDINIFLTHYAETPFEVVAEFTEVQSGKNSDRPELAKALDLCRKLGATLLVSKLDRLSRRVSQIATLMEDRRIRFRVFVAQTLDQGFNLVAEVADRSCRLAIGQMVPFPQLEQTPDGAAFGGSFRGD